MKKSWVTIVVRSLLGFIFLLFGLNGFLHFLAMPPLPPEAVEFFGAMAKTGYMLPLLFATQVVCGALLLCGVLVPLALTILAPVVVNIIGFHLFLAPGGMPLALVLAALELASAWQYREAFAPMLNSAGAEAAGIHAGARA
jgi:uncharacterized membrane protein YphA (DoxX/SURF4 family)